MAASGAEGENRVLNSLQTVVERVIAQMKT